MKKPPTRAPGRPPATGTARSSFVFVRVTPAERASMEARARAANESLTEWARRRLMEGAA